MTCKDCANLGYQKENGDHVCKWGLNFNFKRNSYDANSAWRCKDYKAADTVNYLDHATKEFITAMKNEGLIP